MALSMEDSRSINMWYLFQSLSFLPRVIDQLPPQIRRIPCHNKKTSDFLTLEPTEKLMQILTASSYYHSLALKMMVRKERRKYRRKSKVQQNQKGQDLISIIKDDYQKPLNKEISENIIQNYGDIMNAIAQIRQKRRKSKPRYERPNDLLTGELKEQKKLRKRSHRDRYLKSYAIYMKCWNNINLLIKNNKMHLQCFSISQGFC